MINETRKCFRFFVYKYDYINNNIIISLKNTYIVNYLLKHQTMFNKTKTMAKYCQNTSNTKLFLYLFDKYLKFDNNKTYSVLFKTLQIICIELYIKKIVFNNSPRHHTPPKSSRKYLSSTTLIKLVKITLNN